MYKRRLPSFVAYLLELTACVLALLPENEWNNRSTFNTGNVDLRNIAREVPNITASSKKYRRCRARDGQLFASAGEGAHALDRL